LFDSGNFLGSGFLVSSPFVSPVSTLLLLECFSFLSGLEFSDGFFQDSLLELEGSLGLGESGFSVSLGLGDVLSGVI
jgi:hypothetical protein